MEKKTLISIPCLLTGGTEIQTINLLNALRSLGHHVYVLCYFEYENLIVDEIRRTGVTVKLLDLKRGINFIALIYTLRKEIRAINPDVVHVQYMAPGALPIIAARLAGVKTVYATVHQPYTKSHGRLAKIMLRASSLLATKFIAVSQNAEKSWFGSSYLFDEINFPRRNPLHFTIHNAVDTAMIKTIINGIDTNELKKKLSIPAGATVIGAVSRIRQEKGIDILVEAFTRLNLEATEVHLLLVGTGPDENLLKKRVLDSGVGSSVTFYGEAEWEKAIQIMAIMDIVVVPSRFEGFGLTAAEAMAAGKPVVASDTTGLKEIILNNEAGILFPVNDISALMLALQKLISNPVLSHCLGSAGQKRVSENFSLEIFERKIKALYCNYFLSPDRTNFFQ